MKVNYIMQPTGTPNGTFTINRKDTFNVNNALVFFNKYVVDKVFNLLYKRLNWLLSPK